MAEMDAALAIENAVQQLNQEAGTLARVHKWRSLRMKLRIMSSLLREFDGRENKPIVEKQLQEVRDIAYEAQDEIESIILETKLQDSKGKLAKLFSRKNTVKHHLETIENIEKRIEKEVSQQSLVRQLISGGTQREVIFIVGENTSLAKMVYDNTHIHDNFSCREWVNLSRESEVAATLPRILQKTHRSTQGYQIDDDVSMDEIYKSFKGQKYLIVLDNLCNSEDFNAIMSSIPDDSNGSRILVTSTLEPTSLGLSSNVWSYQLTPPGKSQSWELTADQVFQVKNSCPPNRDPLGKKMVDTCIGSPESIMKHGDTIEEIGTQARQDLNPGQSRDNADLSKDLCFLYLGIFPEGSDILAKEIVQMWAGEGLLENKRNQEVEEIGEEKLKAISLSERSFIQASPNEKGDDDASVKKYRITRSMSHLCSEIEARKLSWDDGNATLQEQEKTIRLGIDNRRIKFLQSCKKTSHLHSLYTFGERTKLVPPMWKSLMSRSSKLRVLNMGSLELDRVPRVIGELIHLRYLKLVAPTVTRLPSSFGNLHNLETLDMRESNLRGRLHGIWKMKHLRHVYLGRFSMPNPNSIDYYKTLPSLQTLSGVHPDKILKRLMVRAKFPNIKRLRLCSLDRERAFSFLNSLDHLDHLRSLRIEKPIEIPHDPNAFPLSLSKITLLETSLKPACIKKLEKLPNLKVLKLLKKSIIGEKISCTRGGFPQLEVLYLEDLVLEKLTLDEGATPYLKSFYIKDCPKLTVPKALQKVVVR